MSKLCIWRFCPCQQGLKISGHDGRITGRETRWLWICGFGRSRKRINLENYCFWARECLLKIICGMNPSHKAELGCNWLEGQFWFEAKGDSLVLTKGNLYSLGNSKLANLAFHRACYIYRACYNFLNIYAICFYKIL
jgi:hypothetical protein